MQYLSFWYIYCTPGLAEPVEKICSQLLGILNDPRPPPTHPIGYLTTMERDQWAELREELTSNAESAKNLSILDSAMFVLCLDDHEPTTIPDFTFTMLHNHGANRWEREKGWEPFEYVLKVEYSMLHQITSPVAIYFLADIRWLWCNYDVTYHRLGYFRR